MRDWLERFVDDGTIGESQLEEARSMAQRGRKHLSSYDLKSIIQLHEELYAEALISTDADLAG